MSLFLAMETAIVEQLEARFADMSPKPRVYTSTEIGNIKDQSQGDLNVFVAYNGIIAAEPQAPNIKHIGSITNQWLVWVVARSSRGQRNSGDGIRELADPVLERVIESLMGQKLLKEYEALTITDTIPPAYGDGFGYFPLAFNARKTVRGK